MRTKTMSAFLQILMILLLINCSNKKKENLSDVLLKISLATYTIDSEFSRYAISDLDAASFVGKWFEYKRINNSFQFGLSNVTAEYGIIDPLKLSVKNSGFYSNGAPSVIEGVAIIKNPAVKGFLKVSFLPVFFADYYVLKVNSDSTNALIGGPAPNILWILSKTGSIDTGLESEWVKYAESIGYLPSLLERFVQ